MDESDLIARQAMEIEALKDEVKDLRTRIERARLHIYCIGGPLNDNKLGYTHEQKGTFWRIYQELGDD